MPMDQSCSWGRTEKEPQDATDWRSPPDPTDKQIDGVDQVVIPALVGAGAWFRWALMASGRTR